MWLTGPAEQGVQWRHVSTVFWQFSAISKTVRQRSVGQTVQKLEPIIDLGPRWGIWPLRSLLMKFQDMYIHIFEVFFGICLFFRLKMTNWERLLMIKFLSSIWNLLVILQNHYKRLMFKLWKLSILYHLIFISFYFNYTEYIGTKFDLPA